MHDSPPLLGLRRATTDAPGARSRHRTNHRLRNAILSTVHYFTTFTEGRCHRRVPSQRARGLALFRRRAGRTPPRAVSLLPSLFLSLASGPRAPSAVPFC